MWSTKVWCAIGLFVACEAVGTIAFLDWRRSRQIERFRMQLPAEVVWSNDRVTRGPSDAPYQLVEFGDFMCPPCKTASLEIEKWQAKEPQAVCFEFRHLPLTDIHPKAGDLALAGEAVPPEAYWKTHRQLYDLQDRIRDGRASVPRADASKIEVAAKLLADDKALADKYDWGSTPMLLLITPGKKVYRCPNVEAAKDWVVNRRVH